jgi:hypothetical protein
MQSSNIEFGFERKVIEFGGFPQPFQLDEFLGKVLDEQWREPFDLLLGRKTFEIFASYWPYCD